MTYRLRSPRDRRPLPDGPHDHGGADGERADSGRRAACPDCFPLIDDCGRGGHLKVRRSGHARRRCSGRGGHFEVRRSGHISRRCTGPFAKGKYPMLFFPFVFYSLVLLFNSIPKKVYVFVFLNHAAYCRIAMFLKRDVHFE